MTKLDKKIKTFTGFIICLIMLSCFVNKVLAFGIDLNGIKISELTDKTQVVLSLSKFTDKYEFDNSQPGEIKIILKETYLSTDLIKNLDIILNDDIKWKQYSDRLDIIIKHKAISKFAEVKELKKQDVLIIDIPKNLPAVENNVNTNETVASSIKPVPPKTRPVNVSRSISSLRKELPHYVKNNRSNPNNRFYYKQIYPGVTYLKMYRNTSSGPLFINVIDVAPNNSTIELIPALANQSMFGKKTIRTIVKENKALAGINAGFFKPPTGIPLGTLIIDDELVSGPIYDRVTLGITRDNGYKIERIHLTGQLITKAGKILKIDNVNQPRLSAGHNLLYSYRWGWKTPESPKGTKQISLVDGKVRHISADPLPIPRNGYVIVGPDTGLFSTLHVGDELKLIVTTDPDWSDVKHAVGGGPFLVKDGVVYVDKDAQNFTLENVRAPRTAVGVTKDDHLLMVTVDGRQEKVSVGVTFYQLAALMIELGAVNAMNLDGGSSTQMCIGDFVVNSPTVSGGNNVSNGLIIVPGG